MAMTIILYPPSGGTKIYEHVEWVEHYTGGRVASVTYAEELVTTLPYVIIRQRRGRVAEVSVHKEGEDHATE